MIGRGDTYFYPEQCLNGHFILTGRTSDIFCGERPIPVSLREELSEHLRRQGFSAVIFLDSIHTIYCYDTQSYQILREGRAAPEDQPPSRSRAGQRIAAEGPLGQRTRSRRRTAPAPQADSGAPVSLNLGRISLERAWDRISSLMRDPNLRCAFVFPNADTIAQNFHTRMLQVLEELSAGRTENHSIAVYIYSDNSLRNLMHSVNYASGPWQTFVQSVLLPHITSANEADNYVLSLGAPNAAEIRNLLTWVRLRPEDPLPVNDIGELSQELAVLCAREGWQLRQISVLLERFAREHPGVELDRSHWQELTGSPRVQTALEELDSLIGLAGVKDRIHALFDQMDRTGAGRPVMPAFASRLAPPPAARGGNGHDLNIVIKGAPGTGKSTIARLIGRLYYECGVLPIGHLHETSAGEIVGEGTYGSAARMIRRLVNDSLGGVLFIDEAYSLLQSDALGREAIDELVAQMSAHEGQLSVVLAGYPRNMDRLMETNEGLERRFPNEYVLEDYNAEEMQQLLLHFAQSDPDGVSFSDQLTQKTQREDGTMRSVLDDFCESWRDSKEGVWQNAGEAQALLVEMKRINSTRLRGEEPGGFVLSKEDIPERLRFCLAPRTQNLDEAMTRIDEMIGLKNIKAFLKELALGKLWGADEKVPGNYIFSGPPGTGKTHVARLMGEILRLLGISKRGHVTERKASDLLPEASESADSRLSEAVEVARRGILFIDEAHQLADSAAGRSVLRALVPIIEDPEIRSDTGFILAGYNNEMLHMLQVDSGLSRRFPERHRIRFTDYSAHELRQILDNFARDQGEIPGEDYLDRSEAALERYLASRPENFGNAGYIRDTYLPQSITARTARLTRENAGGREIVDQKTVNSVSHEEKHTLTAQDIPHSFRRYAAPDAKPAPEEDAAARLDRELVGKAEVRDFIQSFQRDETQPVFLDAAGSGSMHYTIAGPTGCGRKTAAKLIAGTLYKMGLLETDHARFVSKGDLEAQYVGQTAPKTQDVVDGTVGGTLVVLSPSAMLRSGAADNSFGPEALSTLIGNMSAHMNDTSFVFIDSPDGMDAFVKQFPNVRSLLGQEFQFEDLTPGEMERLFHLKTDMSFTFDGDMEELLPDFFLNWVSQRGGLGERAGSWGNGDEMDRLVDALRLNWEKQHGEMRQIGSLSHRVIVQTMFPAHLQRYFSRHTAAALEELEQMTGMARVKTAVRAIERRIRLRGAGNVSPGLYCYMGNPGTGKTTVARLMGGILRTAGVLSQGHVIERKAQDFVSAPSLFEEALKLAKNGILFIDEAHQLRMSGAGLSVIQRLLTTLENTEVTSCTSVILAGYPDDMQELLEMDSGLDSRFGTSNSLICFDDYTPDELCRILEEMAQKADQMPEIGAVHPLELTPEYIQTAQQVFQTICARKDPHFGNARGVRNYLHDSVNCMTERVDTGGPIKQAPLTGQDIPAKYRKLVEATAAPRARVAKATVSIRSREIQDVAALERGVVLLEIYRNGQMVGSGSGSIITADGIILTCQHVAVCSGDIVAYLRVPGIPGGKPLRFPCTRMAPAYRDCDMALLKMDGSGFPVLDLRPPEVAVGAEEKTLVLGYSLGNVINGRNLDTLNPTRYTGSIASIQEMPNGIERCYIDSRGTAGNSGSPVFSFKDGRVIGVFTGSIKPNREEINFFIPIKYFWQRFIVITVPETAEEI